ncbi:ABC-2 type transport system ATP-binding protein [Actinoalloteichus hymeniacidonis]|uniref:DUF4162 family protein n=1 Tax=Actinoalloteichus hymeniacidonis TaxID=340345 RepID=A0AAC9HMF0_9PSEU|nr:putative DUF4162 family protein [Actinoalloteichus hymeniacidonis]MBB5910457.1 ABC-2 type transport system ATP-binding protein [Actinoalloteichus hymeniacidonis]
MIHEPELIFLDEPTAALDPQSRRNLWDHIAALHAETGKTVCLTTHYLEEADALCERVLVIDGGRIVAEGNPAHLKSQVAGDAILLGTDRPEAAAEVLGTIPAVAELATEAHGLRLRIPEGRSVLPELLRALDHASIVPTSVEIRQPSLDDVFFQLTGRSLRDVGN